jgi:hypothetical protein
VYDINYLGDKMYSIKLANIKSGVISGLLGAWAIFGALFLLENTLRLDAGTFYRVIAIAFGFREYTPYIGFLMHMLTGTIIGILFSIVIGSNVGKVYKSMLFGIIAGIITWSVLFIPITTFLINPSLERISNMINEPKLITIAGDNLFMIGSILMHLAYGFVLGFMYHLGVVEVKMELKEKEV